MKKLLLFICLAFLNFVHSQTQTITIGAGAYPSSTSDYGVPILKSGNSSTPFSQSVQLLKESDLSNLPYFSSITSFGFFKAAGNLNLFQTANVKIYMKNTTNSSLVEYKTFSSWINDATLVYSNANYTFANTNVTTGLVSFSCNNFIYFGAAIEIYIEFTINGSVINSSNGGFTWIYDATTNKQSIGNASFTNTFNNIECVSSYNRRYKTSLTFDAPIPCSIALPGNTLSTNLTPCYGDLFTVSLFINQTGTTYQWYNSSGLIVGATNNTYTTAANFITETYYCRVTCTGSTSENSIPISINPVQPISSFPFLETFEDNSPTAKCWKSTFSTPPYLSEWNRSKYLYFENLYPYSGLKFMVVRENSSEYVNIESPEIQLPVSSPQYKELSYKYNINTLLNVAISINNGPFTVLYYHNDLNSLFNITPLKPWSTNTIALNNYDGQNIKIRFRSVTISNGFLAIDDVSIKDSPLPCSTQPIAPTVTITSVTNANVYFSGLNNTNYVLEYGLSGFTPGLENLPGVGGTVINTSTSPVILNGLQIGQTYSIYLRQKCPATLAGNFVYSINSSPAIFNTCSATDVPYYQNFETATVPGVTACTLAINSSTGNVWATQTNTIFGASSKTLRYNFNNADANTWFFTQGINLQVGVNYVLKYKYNSTGGGYIERMKVAYGTASTELAMTNIVATYPTITSSATQNATFTITPSATGVYYFGFNCYSTAVDGDQLYVDDISLVTEASLATADNNIENNLKIYPNPTTGILNLELLEEATVFIFDISGKQLLTQKTNGNTQFDMSAFAKGIYVLKVVNANAETKTLKIVKN